MNVVWFFQNQNWLQLRILLDSRKEVRQIAMIFSKILKKQPKRGQSIIFYIEYIITGFKFRDALYNFQLGGNYSL